jgi:pimeloyl-ACP methyl ester carboxylesterase
VRTLATSRTTILVIMKSRLISAAILHALAGALASPVSAAAPDASPHNTYVIVHGAWGAGYEWKEVGRRLLADGHVVYRPTLTGMGERSHLSNPEIDLETHIMDVVNTILFEDLRDVILVGHSYGGAVITGVADRVPDRLKRIIYLDAFLPENGGSLNRPGETLPANDGFVPPPWNPPPSPPPHPMPQPAKTFSQPIVLKNQEAVAKIPTIYILTVDPGKRPEEDMFYAFSERARARGWKIVVMEADHTPQFSRQTEIVQLLKTSP